MGTNGTTRCPCNCCLTAAAAAAASPAQEALLYYVPPSLLLPPVPPTLAPAPAPAPRLARAPSVLMEHFEELLPIVSTPTVREACQRYGLMFKSLPRGLFVTLEDRGRVFRWEGGSQD